MSASRFTNVDNRHWWNDHDWSQLGEEWTPDRDWKAAIVSRFLAPYIPVGCAAAEIGPGGGRWTEILLGRVATLYLLDVADRPLRISQARFRGASNCLCLLTDGHTIPLASESLDAIWSYDVFVHVNPADAQLYFREFSRVLRPGGHAVVHHPGTAIGQDRVRHHRSDLADAVVVRIAKECGLQIAFQTRELVNAGDVLTVVRKGLASGRS